MPSRGQVNPRRGISEGSRWGWGPSASEKSKEEGQEGQERFSAGAQVEPKSSHGRIETSLPGRLALARASAFSQYRGSLTRRSWLLPACSIAPRLRHRGNDESV